MSEDLVEIAAQASLNAARARRGMQPITLAEMVPSDAEEWRMDASSALYALRAHLLSDEAVERAAAAIRSLPAIPGFDKHKMRKSHGEAYRLIASTAIKAALGEKP